jgi:transcriptional regulator with XRE-family HTH domain
VTPQHSRAARSWLGWSQSELARRAKVSLSTVRDYETEKRNPIPNNIEAIRRAIEEAGIELVYDPSGVPAGILVRGATISRDN